jgi:hypothetical protein
MDLQEIGGVDSSGSGGVWWQAVLSAAMKTSYCVKGREFPIASVELFFSFTELFASVELVHIIFITAHCLKVYLTYEV